MFFLYGTFGDNRDIFGFLGSSNRYTTSQSGLEDAMNDTSSSSSDVFYQRSVKLLERQGMEVCSVSHDVVENKQKRMIGSTRPGDEGKEKSGKAEREGRRGVRKLFAKEENSGGGTWGRVLSQYPPTLWIH